MSFYIQNIASNLVLDIKDNNSEQNATVIAFQYHGGNNQLCEYKNGMIHSLLNNFVLDISQNDGKSVITYPAHGAQWQKWHFDADNTIRCEFRNLVLDVEGSEYDSGTKIIAFQKHNNGNQLFKRVYA